jgi:hypothetical protein
MIRSRRALSTPGDLDPFSGLLLDSPITSTEMQSYNLDQSVWNGWVAGGLRCQCGWLCLSCNRSRCCSMIHPFLHSYLSSFALGSLHHVDQFLRLSVTSLMTSSTPFPRTLAAMVRECSCSWLS